MNGTGVYCVNNNGNARVEFTGTTYNTIPDTIWITHGTGYTMKGRYYIISNPG